MLSNHPLLTSCQVAGEGDATGEAIVFSPEEREGVELGEIRIERVKGEEESLRERRDHIFDPVPMVEGVNVSGDSLLDVRANAYSVSERQRREAEVAKA